MRRLFPGDSARVVFDVGACEGEMRASRCPNHKRIAETSTRYGIERITVVPEALSDTGTADFHVSSGRPESAGDEPWEYGDKSISLLPPAPAQSRIPEWLRFDERITVPTTTLQPVMERHAIDRIDFMHVDVQGRSHGSSRGG